MHWFLTALAVFWIAQLASSLRCVYCASALGGTLPLRHSIRAHFVGLWFNQILVSALGGDVVKIALLKKDLGLDRAIRAAILERVSGLLFLIVAIVIALPLYREWITDSITMIGFTAAALGALTAMMALAVTAESLLRRFDAQRKRFGWAFLPLQIMADIATFAEKRLLLRQFWTSAIVHVNGIVSYMLLGKALAIELSLVGWFLLVPLVFLIALIPISLGGWGIREVGAVWIFGLAGMAQAEALALSITFGVFLVVAALPGLVLFLSSTRPAR